MPGRPLKYPGSSLVHVSQSQPNLVQSQEDKFGLDQSSERQTASPHAEVITAPQKVQFAIDSDDGGIGSNSSSENNTKEQSYADVCSNCKSHMRDSETKKSRPPSGQQENYYERRYRDEGERRHRNTLDNVEGDHNQRRKAYIGNSPSRGGNGPSRGGFRRRGERGPTSSENIPNYYRHGDNQARGRSRGRHRGRGRGYYVDNDNPRYYKETRSFSEPKQPGKNSSKDIIPRRSFSGPHNMQNSESVTESIEGRNARRFSHESEWQGEEQGEWSRGGQGHRAQGRGVQAYHHDGRGKGYNYRGRAGYRNDEY